MYLCSFCLTFALTKRLVSVLELVVEFSLQMVLSCSILLKREIVILLVVSMYVFLMWYYLHFRLVEELEILENIYTSDEVFIADIKG